MMVVISIKLSDGSVIRGRTENGSCSMNGASVRPVKWKPRKVSAVREFPPGCGPIVQPLNVLPNEGPTNALPNEEPKIVVANEGEPVSLPVDNNDNDNNHVANDVGTVTIVLNEGETLSLPGDNDNSHVANDAAGNVANGEVGKWEIQVENKEAKTIPKMKFKRRRVSAVREFPPYCGPDAEEPTEEERRRINGKKSCGTEANGNVKGKLVKKTRTNEPKESFIPNQEKQMAVKVDNVEDGKTIKSGPSKKAQNIGQACQELVVYSRDKVLKKPSPVHDPVHVDYEDDVRDHKPLSQVQKDMDTKSRERVKKKPFDDTNNRVFTGDKIKVVMGLKAPALCAPGTEEKDPANKAKDHALAMPKSSVSKKQKTQEKVVKEPKEPNSTVKGEASTTPKKSKKKEGKNKEKNAYTGTLEMVVRKEEDFVADFEEKEEFFDSEGAFDVDVSLPPFGPESSNDARDKVRQTLRLFQALCRKLLQGDEARADDLKLPKKRVDLGAKTIMAKRGKLLPLGKKTHGPVPGVEVGDEFQYRVELALVGIHRIFQGGIDYVKMGKDIYAVSVVASGGYNNEVDKPDCMMYSGAGGIAKDKSFENQKLERGNLALKNNIEKKYPVRVVRGYKEKSEKSAESSDSKLKSLTTYIYDGLYTVESCQQVTGPNGNLVFNFELKRVPGQPQLAIREVKSKKFKKREGVCAADITNGKEVFPICAINTIDDEKPPEFTYITKIMYPEWYKPVPPKGCDCIGRCSDKRCSCAFKNGGEIPYNRNGAIVEAKPLVYECGPSCRCPPSCYNRVTQHGMKIHLEIFKTETRGWGVRSLSSISSGSFICEYIGELLEDKEAEKRTGSDEYLFDIGKNFSDCSVNTDTKPAEIANTKPAEIENEIANSDDGFTIDAASYGNVGRFINHSCSPNLYAQNVLYDQDDKRMPHIMLFAAENIPPLQELTYHYNYMINAVHDADGNIKVKECYCGSPECTGRLY